ncbi:hypothetical protein DFJ63DRAFT_335198 [Scheffersomyces coipomensis]|uniref:uncharacterized protein n=1 Tax=Scheffersomyces coipomensis TaxID=1788519 RepID=UPI00315D690C
MEFQFNINESLLRRSIQLVQARLNDSTHNYLEFNKLPRSKESNLVREVNIGSRDYVNDDRFKGYRNEIALRLRCFHHYVGNRDKLKRSRSLNAVTLKPPYSGLLLVHGIISSCAVELFNEDGIVNNKVVKGLVANVMAIFDYSQLFILPFPFPFYKQITNREEELRSLKKRKLQADAQDNSSIKASKAASFTVTRVFFESFRQIEADVITEVDQGIEAVHIRFVTAIYLPPLGFSHNQINNESRISEIVNFGLLEPVRHLLLHDFDTIDLLSQFYTDKMSITDYCFTVDINNSSYKIPVELKLEGVYNSFKKRNSDFSDIINQLTYQMLTNSSSIGFVFDRECIMIVKLLDNATPQLKVENSTQIRLAKLRCNIQCIRYIDKNPALLMYKQMLRYLQQATETEKLRVASIFAAMKLTDADKKDVIRGKYAFIRSEWRNKFKGYNPVNDYYIKFIGKEPTNIRIPRGFFDRSLFKYVTNIQRENFEDIISIQNNYKENKTKYHSNKTFAFSLSMFLNELRCYNILRGVIRNGLQLRRPPSLQGEASTLNYTPYVYGKGFIDWPSDIIIGNSNPSNFCGFFLLMEEIPQDYPDTEEEYQQAAEIALRSIHAKGLLHGDVKKRNFRYDGSRGRVIFFDFGLSRYSKDRADVLIASSDQEKLAELSKLREQVTEAFSEKPSLSIN